MDTTTERKAPTTLELLLLSDFGRADPERARRIAEQHTSRRPTEQQNAEKRSG